MDRDALLSSLEEYPWKDSLHCLAQVDSTNRYLKDLARQGMPQGTAVLADSQTAGRGRLGRQFDSKPGGLYLSFLLRPRVSLDRLTLVTPMAGVAVLEALEQCAEVRAGVKWVNDIILNGKKLCGILCELVQDLTGSPALVLGIGINVSQREFPPEVSGIATSLALEGAAVRTEDLAGVLLCRLAALCRDFEHGNTEAWLDRYTQSCLTVGKDILVLSDRHQTPAHAEGIGPGGELLVTWQDGTRGMVLAGEVSIRTRQGYC